MFCMPRLVRMLKHDSGMFNIRQSALNACDVYHNSWPETDSSVDFHVIAIRPLTTGSITIVSVRADVSTLR